MVEQKRQRLVDGPSGNDMVIVEDDSKFLREARDLIDQCCQDGSDGRRLG